MVTTDFRQALGEIAGPDDIGVTGFALGDWTESSRHRADRGQTFSIPGGELAYMERTGTPSRGAPSLGDKPISRIKLGVALSEGRFEQ